MLSQDNLVLLSQALGWAYFLAWSLSFYPQVLLNHRRKSVAGLSLDFVALNTIGFATYAIYTINLYFSPEIRREYRARHRGHDNSVALNDVSFAIHAFILSSIVLTQTFIYTREHGQRISAFNKSIIVAFFFLAIVDMALVVFGVQEPLDFLYHLSYFKLYISVTKYIPQALYNWRRQSTTGWSIENILLDFSGGWLSLLQLCVDASIDGDWSAITGNPVKLGLSTLSFVFDSVFIIQHYILYPQRETPKEGKEETSSPTERTSLLATTV